MADQKSTKRMKIVFVGDRATGKTAYLRRCKTGEFKQEYEPTLGAWTSRQCGVEVHPVTFETNKGTITCDVWDTAGQEFLGLGGYYLNADAAVVFCDAGARITAKNVPYWVRDFKAVCPDAFVMAVRNKVDIAEVKVLQWRKLPYKCDKMCDLSVRSCYNWELPLLECMRAKFGDDLECIDDE